jgi:hypothetical protein
MHQEDLHQTMNTRILILDFLAYRIICNKSVLIDYKIWDSLFSSINGLKHSYNLKVFGELQICQNLTTSGTICKMNVQFFPFIPFVLVSNLSLL